MPPKSPKTRKANRRKCNAVETLERALFFLAFTDTHLAVCGTDMKNIRNEIQIFDARHVIVQIGIIGDVSKAALAFKRLCPNGSAVNINFSGVKPQNSCHRFQGRCLACTVMTDKAINFTGSNVKIQIVYCLFVPIRF